MVSFENYASLVKVGVTGFEPATSRPPDVYSNRTELHPAFACAKTAAAFIVCSLSAFASANVWRFSEISKNKSIFLPCKTKFHPSMIYKVTPPSRFAHTKTVLPASKSISNRVLIINALSGSPQNVANLAECDDTAVMLEALRNANDAARAVDVHGAGTSMRFLTAYFSLSQERRVMTGSQRMLQRPISILVDALRSLGAEIEYAGNEGFPPLRVGGGKMHGGSVALPANVSSQYVSALQMIAPRLEGGLRMRLEGGVASRPYINMTMELMKAFGAKAEWISENEISVAEGAYTAKPFTVESDWSAASYWYEIAALAGGMGKSVALPSLYKNSLQGDSKGAEYFEKLGVETQFAPDGAVVEYTGGGCTRLEIDMKGEPDLAQTFVATCCGLGVKFRFDGLANLRVKETDRIAALENEMRKLGYVIGDTPDGTLFWDGTLCPPQENAVIETYDDHRMAMSIAPLCIKTGSVLIDNPQVVAKSYPRYWDNLREAGFVVEEASL